MPRIIEIGKKGPYTGKRLFEILCNLRNFGIGRLVQRISESDMPVHRQPRQSNESVNFYRIVKVAPQMDSELAFGHAWAEQIRNGKRIPFLVKLNTSLPDYRLILKTDESVFVDQEYPLLGQLPEDDLHLKSAYQVPPLMAEFLNRHHSQNHRLSLYRHGLNKQADGFDEQSLAEFKIPYVYEFDEYQKVVRKVYRD